MRKADYAHLAYLLKTRRSVAKDNHSSWNTGESNMRAESQAYWKGQRDACSFIATAFADKASVNWDEFIKACGID